MNSRHKKLALNFDNLEIGMFVALSATNIPISDHLLAPEGAGLEVGDIK